MKLLPALFLCAALWSPALAAAEFTLEEVDRPSTLDVAQMKPKTIYFTDRRSSDGAKTGLVKFEEWDADEKQVLSLFPGYAEPTVNVTVNGVQKKHKEKLHMFVAEARFLISRAPQAVDFSRYATLDFIAKIDPKLTHKSIAQEDVLPLKDPESVHNNHPTRKWCDPGALCLQSRYALEGRLPLGVRLANQLEEGESKKISEFIEFQSEVRLLSADEIAAQPGLAKLTGLETPIVGAFEQNIFYVNHILQFGKVLTVFQPHPGDAGMTVATAYIALAVETDVLEKKASYEKVPVLRNLVPSQVLMGNSSFNTGSSLSAGLPVYTRNQARAIAGLLEQ